MDEVKFSTEWIYVRTECIRFDEEEYDYILQGVMENADSLECSLDEAIDWARDQVSKYMSIYERFIVKQADNRLIMKREVRYTFIGHDDLIEEQLF